MRKRFIGFGIPSLASLVVAIFAFIRQEKTVGIVFVVSGVVFAVLAVLFFFKDRKSAEEAQRQAILAKRKQEKIDRQKAIESKYITGNHLLTKSAFKQYTRLYQYIVEFDPVPEYIELNNDERDLTLRIEDGDEKVTIIYNGEIIGYFDEKIDMIRDWISRDEPWVALLKEYGHKHTILLVFYRDLKSLWANKEQTVIRLLNYSNKRAQNVILSAPLNSRVYFEEEGESGVYVTLYKQPIGRLTQDVGERIKNEECFGILEKTEAVSNSACPYIRIFWG